MNLWVDGRPGCALVGNIDIVVFLRRRPRRFGGISEIEATRCTSEPESMLDGGSILVSQAKIRYLRTALAPGLSLPRGGAVFSGLFWRRLDSRVSRSLLFWEVVVDSSVDSRAELVRLLQIALCLLK